MLRSEGNLFCHQVLIIHVFFSWGDVRWGDQKEDTGFSCRLSRREVTRRKSSNHPPAPWPAGNDWRDYRDHEGQPRYALRNLALLLYCEPMRLTAGIIFYFQQKILFSPHWPTVCEAEGDLELLILHPLNVGRLCVHTTISSLSGAVAQTQGLVHVSERSTNWALPPAWFFITSVLCVILWSHVSLSFNFSPLNSTKIGCRVACL